MDNSCVHPYCNDVVDIPTLVRSNDGNPLDVYLQWFGVPTYLGVSDKQFLFPVNAPFDTFGHDLKLCKVVMIGPLKDWPNKAAIPSLVQQLGSEDTIVMYLLTGTKTFKNGRWFPDGIAVGLHIVLADEKHGPITIQHFLDPTVLAKEIERINS